jgi:hypothetical protein
MAALLADVAHGRKSIGREKEDLAIKYQHTKKHENTRRDRYQELLISMCNLQTISKSPSIQQSGIRIKDKNPHVVRPQYSYRQILQ